MDDKLNLVETEKTVESIPMGVMPNNIIQNYINANIVMKKSKKYSGQGRRRHGKKGHPEHLIVLRMAIRLCLEERGTGIMAK